MGLSHTPSSSQASFPRQRHTKSGLLSNNSPKAGSSPSLFHIATPCTCRPVLAIINCSIQCDTKFAIPRSPRVPAKGCFPTQPTVRQLCFQVPAFVLLQIKTYVQTSPAIVQPGSPHQHLHNLGTSTGMSCFPLNCSLKKIKLNSRHNLQGIGSWLALTLAGGTF